jgi:hexosaminidase
MKKLLIIIFIFSTTFCFSQTLNIIPEPAKAEVKQGTFTITPETKIVYSGNDAEKSISFFNNYLKKYYGFECHLQRKKK